MQLILEILRRQKWMKSWETLTTRAFNEFYGRFERAGLLIYFTIKRLPRYLESIAKAPQRQIFYYSLVLILCWLPVRSCARKKAVIKCRNLGFYASPLSFKIWSDEFRLQFVLWELRDHFSKSANSSLATATLIYNLFSFHVAKTLSLREFYR